MACEPPDTWMKTKVCPIISDSQGAVFCKGSLCYAAYYQKLMGELFVFCSLIEVLGDNAR